MTEKKPSQSIQSLGYSKKDKYINFNSRLNAVQGCLEVLGSRISALPVIIPATAPVDVLAAVLRSGAVPYPIDIDPTDFQMSREGLRSALEALETAVVLFPVYSLERVAPELLEIANEMITIAVHDRYLLGNKKARKKRGTKKRGRKTKAQKELEAAEAKENDFDCVFNVAYYHGKAGRPARIYSSYEQQLKDLVVIRDGDLGLYADPQDYTTQRNYGNNNWFKERFKEEVIPFLWDIGTNECTYCAIQVPTSATGIVSSLTEIGVKARVMFKPLYDFPSIKARWPEENSSFPNLEKIKDTVIAIDTQDYGKLFYDFDEATNIIWSVK